MDKVSLWQVFLRVLPFSRVGTIMPTLHTNHISVRTLYDFSIRQRRLNNTLKNSLNIKVITVGPCCPGFRRRIAKNSYESPKRVIFKLSLN